MGGACCSLWTPGVRGLAPEAGLSGAWLAESDLPALGRGHWGQAHGTHSARSLPLCSVAVKCSVCRSVSDTYDPYLDVALEIRVQTAAVFALGWGEQRAKTPNPGNPGGRVTQTDEERDT